eukprot:2746589-Karenia_brevis.AAC.1
MLKALQKVNESESSSGSDMEDKSASRGLNDVHRLRKQARKHPEKICKEFRQRVMRDLSVRTEQQP